MRVLLLAALIPGAAALRAAKQPRHDPSYDCNGDGAEECNDWDYGAAKCANLNWCEYRYSFGDVLLDQSCRCKETAGRPTEYDCDGDGNQDCGSWDYGRATCSHGHKCSSQYRFGDSLLDHSCRCKPECLGANLKACEEAPPTPAPPMPTQAPTTESPSTPAPTTPAPTPADIRTAILEHARNSPRRAGAHDKAGWLELYAPDAIVEDPVGTGQMVGHENIGHFWNAFIAETDVNFTQVFMPDIVTRSAQCTVEGCQAAVTRWVEISSTLSTGLIVKVEAICVYEVVGSAAGLQIKSLNTYWPLAAQMNQVLAQGWAGFQTAMMMSVSLLQHLGMGGAIRYSQGFQSVGAAGDRAMQQVVESVNSADQETFNSVLSGASFQMPYGVPTDLEQAWTKLTTCRCAIQTLQTASDFTAASLQCEGGGYRVLRLTFDDRAQAVALDGFWDNNGVAGDGCER